MTNLKILITGNPDKDIAREIVNLYPDAHTVSRSSNSTYQMDLTIDDNIFELAKLSKGYDVVINSALIPNFGQTRILQSLWTEWKVEKHEGHLISFGSAVDYFYRPDNRLYPIEKRALRDLNRSLSKHVNWYNSKIRCTYFSFGGVDTEKTLNQWGHFSHFDTVEIAKYTKWIIESPATTNIDELHITPIQSQTKEELKKLNKNNPIKWESGDTRSFLVSDE
jgi:short-subunit dehydrogenase